MTDGPLNTTIVHVETALQCESHCNPPCDYRWLDKYTQSVITDGKRISLSDKHGAIMCVASNYLGTSNASIVTGIITKPMQPSHNN